MFSNYSFLNNSIEYWCIALGIVVLSFLALKAFGFFVLKRIEAWAKRTATTFDDFIVKAIKRSGLPFLYLLSIYIAFTTLKWPVETLHLAKIIFLVVVVFFVLRIITAGIAYFILLYLKRIDRDNSRQKQATGLIIIINAVLWVVAIIFILDNLGYNVGTLLAGLGIGGIAIALAAQTILGDLFSYFVIFFDKPFEIGDFIIVDDKMGTVDYIGIKTTRLQALSGEQLIFSNKDLTGARVHNYKRMPSRRIVFKIGVTYETPSEKLEKIPGIVKEIIIAEGDVRFDRGNFSAFGNFSLDFEFVYIVMNADYNFYMVKQESIYFAILKAFEKEGIEFAYPTQKLFLANETGQ
jgi:small-conductance mechanosensitive channel